LNKLKNTGKNNSFMKATNALLALSLLAAFSAADSLILDCPWSTLSTNATIKVTYYASGALAPCTYQLTTSASLDGNPISSVVKTCDKAADPGYYTINVTSLNTQGVYDVAVSGTTASSSCKIAKYSQTSQANLPELPFPFLLPIALGAILVMRKKN
jgi:hypothetical protein